MLIDSHSHLNFNAFKEDKDNVIKRSLENNIWIINVGSQYKTSKRAIDIAEKYSKGVYASIGLHPHHLETGIVKLDIEETEFETNEEIFDIEKYRDLAKSSQKIVAIGETGLDYYYKPKTKTKLIKLKEKQKEVCLQQLKLAEELNLPVIFHCRMAHSDLIEVLQQQKIRGVIHCFTGDWQEAKKYLEMGFYLGFNGIIFKMDLEEVLKKTPLEKILLETDCPYLTPPQKTGRNEPLYVKYIAQKIAEIKNINFKTIASTTTDNAQKLFKI